MSKYQALIWEQNRVALPAAGMCLLMGLVVLAVYRGSFGQDIDNLALMIYFAAALATGVVLLLRNDPEGHLVTAFERRLARLPLRTPGLVAVPLLTRLLYLALTCAVLALAHLVLFGVAIRLNYLLLPITLFLIFQAYAWARHAMTGLEYVFPLALLLAPAGVALFDPHTGYWEAAFLLLQRLGHPAVLAVVAVASGAVAFAGVYLERRDRRIGLPTLAELWEWAGSRIEAPREGFDSPLAAQLWYERRRSLLMLPVMTLLVFLGILLLAATLPAPPIGWGGFWRYLPALAMGLAAIPAGLAGMWPRSNYALLRPQDATAFARARMLVIAEAILGTAALVAVLTVALSALRPALFGLLWDTYLHGETRLIEIVAVFLAPALLAGLCTVVVWPLLGVRRIALTLIAFIVAAVLRVLLLGITSGMSPDELHEVVALLTLGLLGLALFGLVIEPWVRAARMRIYPPRVFAVCGAVWLGLALFLWLLGPSTDFPFTVFLICVVLAGLLVLPVISLPLEVQRRRVM